MVRISQGIAREADTQAWPGAYWASRAYCLNMQVPVGKDFRVSAASVARAITRNTVLVVASSPCFPHGVIDDVEGIAKVSPKASQSPSSLLGNATRLKYAGHFLPGML